MGSAGRFFCRSRLASWLAGSFCTHTSSAPGRGQGPGVASAGSWPLGRVAQHSRGHWPELLTFPKPRPEGTRHPCCLLPWVRAGHVATKPLNWPRSSSTGQQRGRRVSGSTPRSSLAPARPGPGPCHPHRAPSSCLCLEPLPSPAWPPRQPPEQEARGQVIPAHGEVSPRPRPACFLVSQGLWPISVSPRWALSHRDPAPILTGPADRTSLSPPCTGVCCAGQRGGSRGTVWGGGDVRPLWGRPCAGAVSSEADPQDGWGAPGSGRGRAKALGRPARSPRGWSRSWGRGWGLCPWRRVL